MAKSPTTWISRAGWALIAVGLTLFGVGLATFRSHPVSSIVTLLAGAVVLLISLGFVLDSGSLHDVIERRLHNLWRLTSGWATARSGENPDTTQAMGRWALRFLVAYVVVSLVVGLATMWTVWTARPAVPALTLPDTVSNVPPADPNGAPTVDSIAPDTVTFGVGQSAIYVFGSGFSEASVARIDGEVHRGGRTINASLMVVSLNESDFLQTRTRYLTVSVEGRPASRAVGFNVRSEADVSVAWRILALGDPLPLTVEARLVLLAALMGLVGGTLASLNSMASFRGEGNLTRSWFLYFFVSPFLGAGVSFVLYTVVRAGLLTGTNVQFEPGATPWGLLAVSGLAGLFYDKTLIKLRELFITLFNPRDTRGGKIEHTVHGRLTIKTEALPAAMKGRHYRAALTTEGGRPEFSWTVDPRLPPGLKLDPLTGVVEGTPADVADLRGYTFTVADMNRHTATATIQLEVRA